MTNHRSGLFKCSSFYLLICLILMHPIAFSLKTSSSELNLVSELSSLDKKYMEAQKLLVDELADQWGRILMVTWSRYRNFTTLARHKKN